MISSGFKLNIVIAMLFSLGVHAFMLFGVSFVLPEPGKSSSKPLQPLEVVLVNSQSKMRPVNAAKMAQNNLDGGGNTAEDRHAKTPLPALGNDAQFTPEQSARRVRQLEEKAKSLLTQLKSDYSVPQETSDEPPISKEDSGEDLVQRSLEIARLEAEISKSMDSYEKLPKRKFIGARTQEYRYARYVEDWRSKVERVGNMNYPQQARERKIYGRLTLTVSIRSDGSLESVEVNRSSGQGILDAAAMRIVKLAAPYSAFPPNIRKETEVLSITRTWSFTSNDHLQSE
ncbi:MAG: energy transducer TonB [Gallionellaceae bacterium]